MTESNTPFTFALNERIALIEAIYKPTSQLAEPAKGHISIKVWDNSVYFLWNISKRLSVGQASFPRDEIPIGDDPYGYAIARAIDNIHNYRIHGEIKFAVTSWSWQIINLDIERIRTLISDIELIRNRLAMYLLDPSESEVFLRGMEIAYRSFGLRIDKNAHLKAFEELGIAYPYKVGEEIDYTWELADRLFQAQILAWKYTYNLSNLI